MNEAPSHDAPERNWLRWVCAVSVALNLLVLGTLAGAALGHRPHMHNRAAPEVGFGPLTDALSPGDRRALRKAFLAAAPDFGDMRRMARRDFDALLSVLRAETWDAEAARLLAGRQSERTIDRVDLGQRLLLDHIGTMDLSERRAFADRLETVLAGRRGAGEGAP